MTGLRLAAIGSVLVEAASWWRQPERHPPPWFSAERLCSGTPGVGRLAGSSPGCICVPGEPMSEGRSNEHSPCVSDSSLPTAPKFVLIQH